MTSAMTSATMRATLCCLAVCGAALAACDDGAPAARGFGSVQLASLRDPTFAFKGARGDFVLYSIGTDPNVSYWSIDVGTGAIAEHDWSFSDVPIPQAPNAGARFHCFYSSVGTTGIWKFLIEDKQLGETTTIDDVALVRTTCPVTGDESLTLWRYDADRRLTPLIGRYDALQVIPLDLAIVDVVDPFGESGTVYVIAGRTPQPDALGIFAIAAQTFAITEVIPPVLAGGAWADGATPSGAMDSTTLFRDPAFLGGGAVRIGEHFGYWRAMSDGGVTFFVGPFASGPARERALFVWSAQAPERIGVTAPNDDDGPGSPPPAVWQRKDQPGPGDLLVWDDAGQRIIVCPSPFMSPVDALASFDRRKVAFFYEQSAPNLSTADIFTTPPGPLMLVDLTNPAAGSGPCATLATNDVNAVGFAPDDSAMFWLVSPPYPAIQSDLWLAGADGSAPREAGSTQIAGPPNPPRFVGPSQLELQIKSDLVWLDVHDQTNLTHTIAEHVMGPTIDRGRWLITGYDASEQDGTARLGVVNRDDAHQKKPISSAVKVFMAIDLAAAEGTYPPPPPRADSALRVVYLVQGRNPSSQDGLWVATINAGDLP